MRKPVIVWIVVVFAGMCGLLGLSRFAAGVLSYGNWAVTQLVGTLFISALTVAAAGWVISGLLARRFRRKAPVSIYLWFVLLIYPISNVLRAFGLFAPAPHFSDEELSGAAAAEILRYVFVIALIVWVGFSKALKAWVSSDGASA